MSKSKKIISLLAGLAAISVFSVSWFYFQNDMVMAGAADNFSGWSWSSNIGWMSFNNTNRGSAINYGVNLDQNNGNLSGWAWSSNVGWIKFDPAGPYPAAPAYSSKLNLLTNQVEGWARVCSGTINKDCASATRTDGWDGWVKMGGSALNGAQYGVKLSACNFTGFAWGSDVVGWIKFQGSQFKVDSKYCENRAPSVTALAPVPPDYCNSGPAITLSWAFSDQDQGDTQSAYQVQIFRNGNLAVDSGKVLSTSNSFATAPGKLVYDATYTWQIKVWDNHDMESVGWTAGTSFSTPAHRYPFVDFSWSPASPSAGETVQFTNKSICYETGGGTASCDKWDWDITDATPKNSNDKNPTAMFTSEGIDKLISLAVRDKENNSCSLIKDIDVKPPLPDWHETR